LQEADILSGDVYSALARRQRDSGNAEDSLRLFREAEKNYSEAIRKGPSDAQTQLAMAALQIRIMTLQDDMLSIFPQEAFEKARAACKQALLIHPNVVGGYTLYGRLYYDWGRILYGLGKEYLPDIKRSDELAKKALALDPNDPDANYLQSRIYVQIGTYQKEHGEDPMQSYNLAISSVKKAIAGRPNTAYLYAFLGAAYTYCAHHEMNRGLDARPSVDHSIENYERCGQINPGEASCFGFLGVTYSLRAQLEAEQGKNPNLFFDKAIQSVKEALRLNPNYPPYLNYLGASYYWKAEYEGNHGIDPSHNLNQAIEAYRKILELHQDDPEANANLCEAFNLKYAFQTILEIDGRESVEQAIVYGENAAKLSPDLDFSILNLGIAYTNLAEINMDDSQKFAQAFDQSFKTLQKTLQINSQYPEAYFALGRLNFVAAEKKFQQGQNPISDLEKARSNLQKALQLNPAFNEARNLITESYRMQMDWKLSRKENYETELREALAVNNQSLSQKQTDALALAEKGALLFLEAAGFSNESKRAAISAESAAAMDEALKINSNLKAKYSKYLKK
jgi:eukaryotic-like serine/threonine-protein kinase